MENLLPSLKKLRKNLGISQDKLAELLNVGVASIRRWESGSTTPLPNHLEKINQLIKEQN